MPKVILKEAGKDDIVIQNPDLSLTIAQILVDLGKENYFATGTATCMIDQTKLSDYLLPRSPDLIIHLKPRT